MITARFVDRSPTLAAADPVSDETEAGRASADSPARIGGVFLLVIDPAAFGPAERYQALVGAALSAAGQTRPAPGMTSPGPTCCGP